MHLLDLADTPISGWASGRIEHRPELIKRKPRPEIRILPIRAQDAPMAV
jgi:hypothetical protein